VTAKPTKAKSKKPKKKSEKRVRSDDESEADGGSDANGKPKRKAGGGFQKPFNLSVPLQEVCGETQVRTNPLPEMLHAVVLN
jgi:upstream activation factor subunit UAF30